MRDLRLPTLGAAAWAGGLLAALGPGDGRLTLVLAAAALVGPVVAALAVRRLRGRPAVSAAAAALVLAAVAVTGTVREQRLQANPVAELARQRAAVEITGTLSADPRMVAGRFGPSVLARLTVREVRTASVEVTLRAPVLVMGDRAWRRVRLGATVRFRARLRPAEGRGLSALAVPRGDVRVERPPDLWWRGAAAVRASVRDAVSAGSPEPRSLVPALVDGDDSAVPGDLADDFRTTGLTHLLAVSGTNLTLLVGFLLAVARWCGVRGRWLALVGALGIAGFVLLARTEPSVVRAAAMGAVGLVAMGANGRGRALRSLGAAVVGLMLLDPALATSLGFALSVLATAGILLLGPAWRDALTRWLPRWLAEAVAVPLAAQLACTPLVAAVSGRVSLVAVGANLLAEPAVGPATVLGLGAGVLGLAPGHLGTFLGGAVGTLACWCVAWIVLVAHRGAALPGAGVPWGTGPLALGVLAAGVLAVGLMGPRLVRHRAIGAALCVLLVLVTSIRPPPLGWPPSGWVLVVCDVGQGDALAVRTGPGSAIVVDAGPEPGPTRRCLDALGVRAVPLLVLTHFHADHVGGIGGVLAGRRVAVIETSRLADPPYGVEEVTEAAARARVPVRAAVWGSTRRVGEATVQVLWPLPGSPTLGPGDGSSANGASVVLLVETHGLRLLLTGDVEPDGQQVLAHRLAGLHVDVLKVPHHGSRYQDEDWLLSLHAAVAVASVGAGNDYGHPARSTLDPLARAGAAVYRTDRDGAVALVPSGGGVRAVTR